MPVHDAVSAALYRHEVSSGRDGGVRPLNMYFKKAQTWTALLFYFWRRAGCGVAITICTKYSFIVLMPLELRRRRVVDEECGAAVSNRVIRPHTALRIAWYRQDIAFEVCILPHL